MDATKTWYTIGQLASRLQVSERCVRGWVADGTIPPAAVAVFNRRVIRLHPVLIEQFIASRCGGDRPSCSSPRDDSGKFRNGPAVPSRDS
jgi:hypothetical protein